LGAEYEEGEKDMIGRNQTCAAVAALLLAGLLIGCSGTTEESAGTEATEVPAVAAQPTKPPPVIEGGRISEQGTHAELIRARGHYYNLYTRQFRREREVALGL
jgi:hypothetical protein